MTENEHDLPVDEANTSAATSDDAVQSGEQLDSAGKPLKGTLKERTIRRSNEFWYFADQIRPRGHNLRMWQLPRNRAKVIEFARTAYSRGIIVPISVSFEHGSILIDHGETRWLAVKLCEGEDIHGVLVGVTDPKTLALKGCVEKNTIQIPATSSPTIRNDIDRLRDTILTNTGQSFADLELADGIKQFTDWGMSQLEIAERLMGIEAGWTQTRVSHLYQLNLATPKLRNLLANEVITTSTVVDALRECDRDPHKAEEMVLGAIEDAKAAAAAEAARLETEAREAQAELQQLIDSGDTSMVEPVPGKRPITRVEHAQRRTSTASEKARAARDVAKTGPKRITSRDVAQAVKRRNPDAQVNVRLSRAGIAVFVDSVRFEAQYCEDAATRERMNKLLVRYGFPAVDARVDNDGNALPLPTEANGQDSTAVAA